LPSNRDIQAAIAAYNATDPEALLPPDTARLLAVMFRRDTVCRRSEASLVAEGFDARTVRGLLRALITAGFLSKEPRLRASRTPNTYHLHLPPRRRR
jgi:hypothetical protein